MRCKKSQHMQIQKRAANSENYTRNVSRGTQNSVEPDCSSSFVKLFLYLHVSTIFHDPNRGWAV